MTFKDLAIGAVFHCNGMRCTKKSTRTAYIGRGTMWFYFGQNESVSLIEKEN